MMIDPIQPQERSRNSRNAPSCDKPLPSCGASWPNVEILQDLRACSPTLLPPNPRATGSWGVRLWSNHRAHTQQGGALRAPPGEHEAATRVWTLAYSAWKVKAAQGGAVGWPSFKVGSSCWNISFNIYDN